MKYICFNHFRHEVINCSHEIRQLSITTSVTTTELMRKPLEKISIESRPAGPSDDAIKQRIRRQKRKIFPTIIPKIREEIVFPDKYTMDLQGFPFLLHDDDHRNLHELPRTTNIVEGWHNKMHTVAIPIFENSSPSSKRNKIGHRERCSKS